LRGIEVSDKIFCYINRLDCYGTLTEIGYASALGIPIYIYWDKGLEINEHWFALTLAKNEAKCVSEGAKEAFEQFLIDSYTPTFESPIEEKLYIALESALKRTRGDYKLKTQEWIGNYRIDIIVRGEGAVFAIECDGHEFHEKTKEQAARDKRRDRDLLNIGIPTIRFTGSEIYENADECAREIIDIINSNERFDAQGA
jgi:very-short-patch-repair endonuclease